MPISNRKRLYALILGVAIVASVGGYALYGLYENYRSSEYTVHIGTIVVKIVEVNQTPQQYLFQSTYINMTNTPIQTAQGGQEFPELFTLTYVNETIPHNITDVVLDTPGFHSIHLSWSPSKTLNSYGAIGISDLIQAPYSNYYGSLTFIVTID